MRQIKFRIWDKKRKLMYWGIKLQSFWDNTTDKDEFNLDFNDLEFMQYIGIVDKTGRMIYEGDIVKTPLYGQRICEVIFINGSFVLLFDNGIGSNIFSKLTDITMEIIGNIQEHSHLLKEK